MTAMVLLSLTGTFAQFNPMENVPADPEVRKGVLDNGMTYYIRHNAKPEGMGEFWILHNVGAIQEEDTQQGLAHFTEHMALNGTTHMPDKQMIEWLESIGVKFGINLNAGTGHETTHYRMQEVPLTRESIIDSALLVLHEWSSFITMDPTEVDKERGVIVEELRWRNNAGTRITEKAAPYIFGDTRYATRNLIGTEEGLRTFPQHEIVDFYQRWYRPDLQAIIIVGDFDVDMMEAKVKTVMADIPARENPVAKEYYFVPENDEPIVGVVTDPEVTDSSVEIFFKRDAFEPELRGTMLVQLINTLDNMTSSITNERLGDIAQKPGAPFTSAGIFSANPYQTLSFTIGYAGAREGEILQAFEALYTEIERIARYGFTESELERAKERILRNIQQAYDRRDDRRSAEFVSTYMNNYTFNDPMPTAETEWLNDKMLIDLIDLAMLNGFIKEERFKRDNQVIVATAPEKEGAYPTVAEIEAVIAKVHAAEIAAPVDDTVKEPLIPEGTKLKGSKVKKTETDRFDATVWTLKNGVKIAVKPTDFEADQIMVGIETMGGASNLPTEMIPSVGFYSNFKSRAGIGKFSASDLRKQLSGKAAFVVPYVSHYTNGYYGSASPKDLETLMQLIYLNFTSPRYDESDFAVAMDNAKTQSLNQRNDPSEIYQENITKTLYGNNPRRQKMTYERLDEVKFDYMKGIDDMLFSNPADFVFTFVGNIDMDEFKSLAEKYLGSLPKSKKSLNWVDDGARFQQGLVENRFTVPMQAPKTTVLYIYNGQLSYTLKHSLTLDALSQILDIRYMESIREEKGGTYGVSCASQIQHTPIETYILQVMFDTDPAMADELMEIVDLEIKNIAENGVKAEDLVKIKEFMIKKHPDNLKQNYYWMGAIDEFHNSGYDFLTGYLDVVNGITAEDVQRIAKTILEENNLIKVIMDPAPAAE